MVLHSSDQPWRDAVFFFSCQFVVRDGAFGRHGWADEAPGLSQTSDPATSWFYPDSTDATRFRVATFGRPTTPFHTMPNTTPTRLNPTATVGRKKGVMEGNRGIHGAQSWCQTWQVRSGTGFLGTLRSPQCAHPRADKKGNRRTEE